MAKFKIFQTGSISQSGYSRYFPSVIPECFYRESITSQTTWAPDRDIRGRRLLVGFTSHKWLDVRIFKLIFPIILFVFTLPTNVWARGKKSPQHKSTSSVKSDGLEINGSTIPIGSPFLRHLAQDMNVDLYKLDPFEKRGFGRTEIITLIYISSATQKPLKEFGKRRVKEKVYLRDLAKEANLNYNDLRQKARLKKAEIEAKGDQNLPPPLFPKPAAQKEEDLQEKKPKKKSKKKKLKKLEQKETEPPDDQ